MFHLLTKKARDAFGRGKARLENDLRESWRSEYLLWGILQKDSNEALFALLKTTPDIESFKRDVEAFLKAEPEGKLPAQFTFDPAMFKTLMRIRDSAKDKVTTLDLLIAIIEESQLKSLFKNHGITRAALESVQRSIPAELKEE